MVAQLILVLNLIQPRLYLSRALPPDSHFIIHPQLPMIMTHLGYLDFFYLRQADKMGKIMPSIVLTQKRGGGFLVVRGPSNIEHQSNLTQPRLPCFLEGGGLCPPDPPLIFCASIILGLAYNFSSNTNGKGKR